ncbi:MAG: hypothetical protein M1829_002323 [Trizodia sp. TS-e1964]|nr:MAG: hypothetical protein M1829_002323 [Trizodia sp. TS-e1964]
MGGFFANFGGFDHVPLSNDSVDLEDRIQKDNQMYSWIFYIYFGSILIFFTLVHLFRRIYIQNGFLRNDLRSLAKPARVIRRWSIRKAFWPFTTRGHMVIITGYVILNVVLSITSPTPDLPYIMLARRTGWLSTLNYTILLLMSMKSTPLSKLTGYSYERLNVFHRWIAVIAWMEGSLHTIAIGIGTSRLIPDQSHILVNHENSFGILALAGWTIMMLSFPLLKKMFYEWFYVLHAAFFPVVTVALFLHNRHCREPVAVGVALYALDRFIRTDRYIWHNQKADKLKATLQVTEDGATLVSVPRNNMSWRPGSHAFLNIPRLRYFQSHPFTIASVDAEHAGTDTKTQVQFLIKPQRGFTRALMEEAERSKIHCRKGFSREVTAYIDGPYGAVPDFKSFDRTILIAAGSGITFILPIALSLVRSGRFRSIDFVWAVRNKEAIEAVRRQLEEITAHTHFGEEGSLVNVRIQITGKTNMPKMGTLKRMMTMARPKTSSLLPPKYDLYGSSLDLHSNEKLDRERHVLETLPIHPSLTIKERHTRSASIHSVASMVSDVSNNSSTTNLPSLATEFVDYPRGQMHRQSIISTDESAPAMPPMPPMPPMPIPSGVPIGYPPREMPPAIHRYTGTSDTMIAPMPESPPGTSRSSMEEDFNASNEALVDNVNFDRCVLNSGETEFRAKKPKRDALTRFYVYGRPDVAAIIANTVSGSSDKETIAVGACGVRAMTNEVRKVVADSIEVRGPSISLFCEEFGW